MWSWDITYVKTPVRGTFLYLYLILEIWSRRIMGWAIRLEQTDAQAATLCTATCARRHLHPHWYNHVHQHSAIRFVTPDARHAGGDVAILARRDALYTRARAQRPARWSLRTRDWSPIPTVQLNPEQEAASISLSTIS